MDGILLLLTMCQLLIPLQLCQSQYTCSYGDVRLINGRGAYEGRVEICAQNRVWKTTCDDYWSNIDAQVVCAQLHYPPQDALALSRAAFGQGTGSILEEIGCRGSELRIVDCPIRDRTDSPSCSHVEDAGARCLSCSTHGAVRLRGSGLSYYGRVEICVNGVWGTVCDDFWDTTDAGVVCKQLGYSKFGSRHYTGAAYGRGRGPIHLDNVRCIGNEQRLIDCPYINNTRGWDCTHAEDASVYCRTNLQCQEGNLRLVGGRTNQLGTVEICIAEVWGTICANNWRQSEATVTCRQLGFSRQGATVQSIYGPGTGPVHYSNLVCTGTESRLTSCQRYNSSFCSSHHKAGVHCSFDHLPSPERFQVTCSESNVCRLSWQPPLNIYYRRYGNLLNYVVNCSLLSMSTMETRRRDIVNTTVWRYFTSTQIRLQPYRFYNCCVAAVNQAGRGSSTYQTIITHETAPTAAPTNIEVHQLNSTSVFLSWRPPLAEYQNGIIQSYLVVANSNDTYFEYTTQDAYLLMDNLQPVVLYSCMIAAFTVGRGPFSEQLTIILSNKTANITEEGRPISDIQSGSRSRDTTVVATLSALLVAVVIVLGFSFIVLISYKIVTRKKKQPIQNVYETVKDPKPTRKADSSPKEIHARDYSTSTATQIEHNYLDGSLTPPLPPRTYSLSSSLEKIDNLENLELQDLPTDHDQLYMTKPDDQRTDRENTYQPLILPHHSNTTTTSSVYQSLTHFKQCQEIEGKL